MSIYLQNESLFSLFVWVLCFTQPMDLNVKNAIHNEVSGIWRFLRIFMLEFWFGSLKAPTVPPFLLDEILRKKVLQSFRKHVGRDRVVDFGPSLKNMPIIVLKEKNLRCCFTPSALVQLKIVIQKIPENWVFELKIGQNYRLRNPLN